VVDGVHILPFFPFTSDDGFAVTDYMAVNPQLGDWPDINRIASDFKLMSDLVLNHVSSQGTWFNAYRQGQPPYDRFFFEADPADDLSMVVRPRTTPLLQKVDTKDGPRYVWCTFSHDQIDLDFRNPEVLLEFLRIIRTHIDNGVQIIRLDAVAFLWKEVGSPPYDRFFFEADPADDLSMVVRPRTTPLLQKVDTKDGPRYVWCTFSHDQIDLDFRNPEVLLEFLRIIRTHIDNGVQIIRLDAVAFLWKEVGSPSIHLPQTHAIVKLIRLLCDYALEPIILLTETNVPKAENLSYFGKRDEAHVIYNFPLPPLILHALLSGSAANLDKWQRSMPPAPLGCAYLNFTASHDGIGMRPAEGLLSPDDQAAMIKAVKAAEGRVSMRALPDGGEAPYELNTTYFAALSQTFAGPDAYHLERFLCSQTIVMSLEGIPAFYIHSMLATPNDTDAVERRGMNRAINRHRWDYEALQAVLRIRPRSMQRFSTG